MWSLYLAAGDISGGGGVSRSTDLQTADVKRVNLWEPCSGDHGQCVGLLACQSAKGNCGSAR